MATYISPLAHVDPRAQLGNDVHVGPFCLIGPDVTLGDGCRLDSHVTLVGRTTLGGHNRLWPYCAIGGEPQDRAFRGTDTQVVVGDYNLIREGVTIHRGSEKEDGVTRIGSHNYFFANSHVAHDCHVRDHVMLVNGVLLGGHVHVHDRAIISGNSVVHQFATIGTVAIVSGGCRVSTDVAPYMTWAGSEDPGVRMVNLVGMQRAGVPPEGVARIKTAYRLLFRQHRPFDEVRAQFVAELGEPLPHELTTLFEFIDAQRRGKMGRAREAVRSSASVRKAA
jgi:UDP-N-acetylglucosamine acyltransferase